MRFLVDNALSPLIAKGLRDAGFEALHVRDIGMHSASGQVIFDYARTANLTIVTADTDFGTLLALWQYSTDGKNRCSFVALLFFAAGDLRRYSRHKVA